MINSNFSRTIVLNPSQQIAASRFVSKTYGWMFVGLMVTAAVALFIGTSESAVQWLVANRWAFYTAMIAEFALVLGLSAAIDRLSPAMATAGFLGYSALNGVTLSLILLIYTATSIGHVFLITAGMFGGLAVFGTVTKKDLTSVGAFVGMGLWGLILVGLVNLFVQSESLSLGLSAAGVLIFAGLTAYDSQRIRAMAYASATGPESEASKQSIIAALMLYLNFINLFLSLLRLFGNRRE